MTINGQLAQIRLEKEGCTVIHMNSTYPSSQVSFLGEGTGAILDTFPQEKYVDILISGVVDTKKETITITDMKPC
ncbi:MAG: hypothetical protein PHW24_03455 [Candidatus Moranbacteria bacterium]|nr:hypothetical protein [Candidatus Moranbacteria bacterium]